MRDTSSPIQNRLLADLPPGELVRLIPGLKPVALARQTVIYHVGDPIDFIYFPSGGLIAEAALLEDGQGLEVLSVGREGALGVCALSGMSISSHELTVQITGAAWRIGTAELERILQHCPVFKDRLARYLNVWFMQASQTALCTGRHNIAQRCADKLIDASDRSGSRQLSLTHEVLAMALGVRRAGITNALAALEEEGIIRSGRGWIDIVDAARLRQNSCECSECRQQTYTRFLPAYTENANWTRLQ